MNKSGSENKLFKKEILKELKFNILEMIVKACSKFSDLKKINEKLT